MIVTVSGWILIVAVGVLLASSGALVSSVLNRRKLQHMNGNMQAMRKAFEIMEAKRHQEAKEIKHALEVQQVKAEKGVEEVKRVLEVKQAKDDVRHASPAEVTIVNNPTQPVPVETVNGTETKADS